MIIYPKWLMESPKIPWTWGGFWGWQERASYSCYILDELGWRIRFFPRRLQRLLFKCRPGVLDESLLGVFLSGGLCEAMGKPLETWKYLEII